jgi:hypothetical protein
MTQDSGINISYRISDVEYNVERKLGASIVSKQQICNGEFYNAHGPAVTRTDEQTGIVVFEYWRGFGRGVGYVMRNANTGAVERDTRALGLRLRSSIFMAMTGYGLKRLEEAFLPIPHLRREFIGQLADLLQSFMSSSKSATRLFPMA